MKNTSNSPIYKPIRGEFFVPSFYEDFSCKGSECRNTCCSGWSVKIPMKEYFLLHGLNTSKDLREKIDKALKPLSNRTQDQYAEITFDYNNKCKLLSSEGWCLLHKKHGENILPSVCRYFPRGPRINYRWEASTSNGCEKTIELLFENNNVITYENKELVFHMPIIRQEEDANRDLYIPVRNKCMEIIQDRRHSLPKRIMMLGKLLTGLDESKDIPDIDLFVSDYEPNIVMSYEKVRLISNWFIENTGTFSEYFSDINKIYENEDISNIYDENKKRFEKAFPNHEILLEKVLNNNIFYKQFPFQDYTKNFTDEFIALAGKYFIIRYITINQIDNISNMDDLVDLWSKMFRVIAHTGFEKNIMILFKKMNIDNFDLIGKMILI